MQEKLFPGDFTMWTLGRIYLKRKSLLQAIYLNKQDYMFAVGSLSKPSEPRAYVPAKKPWCLQLGA